jgi:hypothetical protein
MVSEPFWYPARITAKEPPLNESWEHEEKDVTALLATQWEAEAHTLWQPERKLWIAVLTTAINDALFGEDPLTRQTARRWFLHGGRSFDFVCELANFEPKFVRHKILLAINSSELSLAPHPMRRPRGRPSKQKEGNTMSP